MNKKILFFDIDMTLWDFHNNIPESTVFAIRKARENGHLAFINTGRSRAFVQSGKLFDIGFDGIVSGCGTMIEHKDRVVFYHRLENDFVCHVINTVRKYKFRPILEGRYNLYMDYNEFAEDPYGKKLVDELGEKLLSISDNWGNWEISKLSCATPPDEHAECMAALSGDFDFMIHDSKVVEMSPKGFSKGSGIKQVCRLLDTDITDTFAFGDSANDIAMLETAGTAIVMGNGSDIAKEKADYITSDLHDDGIQKAMEHFKLI